MKLLAKREISIDLGRQKKIQIDEGINLARKVDALREQLQTETGNLRRFREEAITGVQKEIDSYVHQKDILKDAVKDLREKRLQLLIPLDVEWARLERRKEQFSKIELIQEQKDDDLAQRQAQVEKGEQEISEEKSRIASLKIRATESLTYANATLMQARSEADSIRNRAQATLSGAELKDKKSDLRERSLETQEYWVEKEKEAIEKAATDLTKREKVLADRTAMLERNIIRNKKKP